MGVGHLTGRWCSNEQAKDQPGLAWLVAQLAMALLNFGWTDQTGRRDKDYGYATLVRSDYNEIPLLMIRLA